MTLYPIAKGRRAVGWSVPATRSFTVLADELRRPRGLARASDGTLYVSAEGSAGRVTTATTTRRTTTRPTSTDADDDDDARRPSSVGTIFRWSAGTGFQVVARAFKHPDGLVVRGDGTLLVAAERFRDGTRRLEGNVFTVDGAGAVGVYVAEHHALSILGSRVVEQADIVPGLDPTTYAYVKTTVHRNIFRIDLP